MCYCLQPGSASGKEVIHSERPVAEYTAVTDTGTPRDRRRLLIRLITRTASPTSRPMRNRTRRPD